jgi:gephyrin
VVIRSTVKYSSDPSTRSEERVVPLKAYSTGGQRSSRAASLCEANGLVVLPPLAPAVAGQMRKVRLEVGEFAEAVVIGEIEMI